MNVCQKFWMVLGGKMQTHHHDCEQSAMDEAERLAKLHRGSTFTVLEALRSVTVTDVVWKEAVEDAELPS